MGAKQENQGEMGLFDHLTELRNRLLNVLISICVTSLVSYFISENILYYLFKPYFDHFDTGMLIGTGPADAFILKIKVTIFTGILIASPIIFLQIWKFVEPGLYDNEKKLLVPFVVSSTTLFIFGVLFCYFVVLPFVFNFCKEQYASISQVTPAIKIDEHLSLVLQGIIGFGLVFEMPLIAYFLGRVGIINYEMMISSIRYIVVIIFIVSAILTPPDVITQFLMAIPLLILYALSIIIVKYTQK